MAEKRSRSADKKYRGMSINDIVNVSVHCVLLYSDLSCIPSLDGHTL